MKKLPKLWIAILAAAFLCLVSLSAVLFYTQPMKDASYDLSLLPEDGQEWQGDKGWKVYKDVDGTIMELASDGSGGYRGLDYAGQTFYYSRELTEALDSPTLQIGAANRNITVFLDDTVVYTDCPELDNQIGQLELPMLEYDRTDPVTLSLPVDYLGKTLTIAQSSPTFSETQSEADTVWPCDVTLFCGYAYESGIIASASSTMLPAALLFALILLLLAAFVWNVSLGSFHPVLLVLTLAVLCCMCSILAKAEFFYRYFGTLSPDPVWLFFHLSVGILPVFLLLYTKDKRSRWFLLVPAVIQWIGILLYLAASLGLLVPYGDAAVFLTELPQLTGFLLLTAILVESFFIRKTGQRFWMRFIRSVLVFAGGYLVVLLFCALFHSDYPASVFSRLAGECRLFLPNFSLKLAWYLCLFSTILSLLLDLMEQESERRTEATMMEARNALAISGYENLRHQTEEAMMLRHDMTKHYILLREMAQDSPEKLGAYLDELLGEVQSQQPVVTTKNEVLDILLNGEIKKAADKDIPVTVLRCAAPERLPLKDSELCCLIMNILDNAINAARKADTLTPYIELDLHYTENHFVFTCKNAASPNRPLKKWQKKTAPGRGYGLKIIQHIMEQHGNMISVEEGESSYQVTIILPL